MPNVKDLILEFKNSKHFDRIKLLPLLAKYAINDDEVMKLFTREILSEKNRAITAFGSIKFSWIPALYLLEEDDEGLSIKVFSLLSKWPNKEKRSFYRYIKNTPKISKFIDHLKVEPSAEEEE